VNKNFNQVKQKIYIDTSVIGGYFDIEFAEYTKPLFDRIISGEIHMIYSEVTEGELKEAPEHVKKLIRELPKNNVEFVELTNEAISLATEYIKENVVGKTSYPDCLHIAIATLQKVDVLVSWNFKHIVNLKRIRGYNSVNLKSGHGLLEIRSPKELIDYEE